MDGVNTLYIRQLFGMVFYGKSKSCATVVVRVPRGCHASCDRLILMMGDN